MWYHHLKVAGRHIQKHPKLSVLKVFGLGLGIAAAILLIKYITWEWNYDRFHKNADQIVRIDNDHIHDGVITSRSAKTYSGVSIVAKDHFPVVENYVRMGKWIANDVLFRNGQQMYRGSDFFFADPSFFDIFSFELIKGDPNTVLAEPNSLVLTTSTAQLLFGDEDPLGKEVMFENKMPFKVTGVTADPPAQSHIQFDLLSSLSTMTSWGLEVYGDQQLNASYVYTYLQLQEGTDLAKLSSDLTEAIASLKPESSDSDVFSLQPLKDIHLYSDLRNEMSATGHGNSNWILSGIVLIILLLGWVNHFNIFTAEVIDRIHALRIQRTLGARRRHLFDQLLISSSLYSLCGLGLGLFFAKLIEPFVKENYHVPMEDISLLTMSTSDPAFYLSITLIAGTILGGIIPALALSVMKSVYLLDQPLLVKPGHFNIRRLLVITQFAIITVLISGTMTIYKQSNFIQNQSRGLETTNVIALRAPLGTGYDNLKLTFPSFREKVESMPGITGMTASHDIPGNELERLDGLKVNGVDRMGSFYRNYGSPNYFDIYEIKYLSRDTTINLTVPDKHYAILNKTASELLGFVNPDAAIGQNINHWDSENEIVGVVDDYHQQSFHHPVVPIIYDFSSNHLIEDGYYSLAVHHATDKTRLIGSLKEVFQEAFPYTVFEPIDVTEHYAAQYQSDEYFKQLNTLFSILGVVIACIGMLGLTMISVRNRKREISIRKILGARISSISALLFKDVLGIIFIAMLIAAPVSYILMSRWLENFSYHTTIPLWTYGLAGGVALMFSMLTVGYLVLKMALINPVEILREE